MISSVGSTAYSSLRSSCEASTLGGYSPSWSPRSFTRPHCWPVWGTVAHGSSGGWWTAGSVGAGASRDRTGDHSRRGRQGDDGSWSKDPSVAICHGAFALIGNEGAVLDEGVANTPRAARVGKRTCLCYQTQFKWGRISQSPSSELSDF